MRKILFRGQTRRKGEKVWMNSKPVDSNWVYGGVFPGEGDYSVIYTIDDIDSYPVYTNTVGQFTGLVDKNGTQIFEGDIIKRFWLGSEIIYCIKYEEENACFIGKALNKSGFTTFNNDSEMFEIIGNIHDNPELLGGEV